MFNIIVMIMIASVCFFIMIWHISSNAKTASIKALLLGVGMVIFALLIFNGVIEPTGVVI